MRKALTERLNQWREACALIGTGFDCHVQHRLITKKKKANPEKIAATIRKHVQDLSVFSSDF